MQDERNSSFTVVASSATAGRTTGDSANERRNAMLLLYFYLFFCTLKSMCVSYDAQSTSDLQRVHRSFGISMHDLPTISWIFRDRVNCHS